MGVFIGRGRKARRAYGFDEIAIVPGLITINPNEVDTTLTISDKKIAVPIIASAMDGVVDVNFAIQMGKMGAIAVLNLEGVQTRYENATEVIQRLVDADPEEATHLSQEIYREPIKEKLIGQRIEEIKKKKIPAVVSAIPQKAEKFGRIAQEAGADMFVIQSTIATVRHIATEYKSFDFSKFRKEIKIPIIAGNTVTYEAALELMATGIDALLVGVGPGAACTTRGVLGIGVPQVTATVDCAAARDFYFQRKGRYIPIITDGGMSNGGDVCKAIASGADGVMIGSAFAKAKEAPGKGYHWGMATPHQNLPRGTRIHVGVTSTLEEILFGPARLDDGSQNLVGAIRTCMGSVGAKTIREMHLCELVIAPAIRTEGKIFQKAQKVGMGK